MKALQALALVLSFMAGVVSTSLYIGGEIASERAALRQIEKDTKEISLAMEKAVKELKQTMEAAIENHIQLGPHAGVPVALARLQEQVMKNGEGIGGNGKRIDDLRSEIRDSTSDRYHRADAIRDRNYFCALNPELKCPQIAE